MKSFLLAAICVLFPSLMMGQYASLQKKPEWTKGFFQEKANTYIEMVFADGSDVESARNKAATVAIDRRSLATGKRVNVSVNNGVVNVSGEDNLTIKSRIIDEYVEHLGYGQYRIYLLVQTAKNPTFDYEPVKITDRYDFSPDVFVPGMAQIRKGSTGKGIFFIAGEVVCIGGIVFSQSMKASYESKINSTHNITMKKDYIDKADMYGNISNIAIAGAAALYVWNVIDGIVAKGKKHVLIGEYNVKVMPYFAMNGTSRISLSFNF